MSFPTGGASPPPYTDHLNRCPPWGISVPLPFPHSSHPTPPPSPLHSLQPLGYPDFFRGRSCCPISLCSPSHLLFFCRHPFIFAPQPMNLLLVRVCRPWGARAWPLGELGPGGELTISAIMACARPSDVPLPPNGGGATSPRPRPICCSPLASSLLLRLSVGGL